VELLGLPDVLCIFLVALSFLLLVSEQPFLSAVALGLGAFVKFFPIFLLPPLLIYMHLKGARRRLLLAAAFLGVLGFIGYFGWILPYGFEYLEIPTPVTQQILFVGGIANTVNPVTFGMFGFYGLQYIFMKKDGPLPMLLSALLAYYILAAPGPQYLMWVLPLVAVDVVFADRLKRLVISVLLAFVFLQWFLVSSAFLTPSGYSLLMFPLGGGNTSLFSAAIGNFLDSRLVDIIILPLVSSATFAMVLAYSVEQTRLWFSVPQTQ